MFIHKIKGEGKLIYALFVFTIRIRRKCSRKWNTHFEAVTWKSDTEISLSLSVCYYQLANTDQREGKCVEMINIWNIKYKKWPNSCLWLFQERSLTSSVFLSCFWKTGTSWEVSPFQKQGKMNRIVLKEYSSCPSKLLITLKNTAIVIIMSCRAKDPASVFTSLT